LLARGSAVTGFHLSIPSPTRLAVPMVRILQIGDVCSDALAPRASDWRTPHRNLLMLYVLASPAAGS
jgi:hypothetical protein